MVLQYDTSKSFLGNSLVVDSKPTSFVPNILIIERKVSSHCLPGVSVSQDKSMMTQQQDS